jgi:predicted PurR-regulated permease PerM
VAALENDSRLITNRWLLALAAAGGLALLLYLLEPILLPFVAGGLIAYLGDPLVDALERRRLNRTVAVALVFAAWAILVLVVLALLAPLLIHQLDVLVHKVPAIYAWLTQTVLPWISAKLDLPQGQVPQLDWTGQLADNWQSLGRVTAQVMKKITGSGATALLWMANVVLIPVVAFYLMRDWDRLMDKALAVMPLAWQEKVSSMVTESHEVVGAFLRGQFLVMCSLGMIYSFGLWLVGVQLALLLGLLAGMASIVPYLGFTVGIISSCLVAYVQFHDWSMLLWVVLVFGVGQTIESMLLTPVLVGDRIGLHPVAVIFALMAGGQIAGFVGIVLALPVGAVIMVFLRHAMDHYRASDIYGSD